MVQELQLGGTGNGLVTIVAIRSLPESPLTSRKRETASQKRLVLSMACAAADMVKNSFFALFFRYLAEFAASDSCFVRWLARTVPR